VEVMIDGTKNSESVNAGTVVIFSYQTHATSGNRNTAENQNAGKQVRPLLRPVG